MLKIFETIINIIILKNFKIILITNFDDSFIKIMLKQNINKLFILSNFVKFTIINININNIFAEKHLLKLKLLYIINFFNKLLIKIIKISKY